jgi:hypothetical protein
MKPDRTALEAEFMHLCRSLGPAWIESVIRPLRLPDNHITVRNIPTDALRAAVGIFGSPQRLSFSQAA